MNKWFVLLLYGAAAVLMAWYREDISAWLQSPDLSWGDLLTTLLTAFTVALVPAIPYSIVAVMFGAKYGPVLGSLINLGVSVSAAVVLFLIIRRLWSAEERRKAVEFKGIARFTALFERSAFMAVIFARLLPFVPAQAVNIYAALTSMNWRPYIIATILGKIPYFLTVTVLGDQLMAPAWWTAILPAAGIYLVFLIVVWLVYRRLSEKGEIKDAGGHEGTIGG